MSIKSPLVEKIGNYRWRICALLFFATTINYMDRSVLGVLGPTLQYKVFNWSDLDYANINIAFKVAYAFGMLAMGAVVDKLGTRLGYALAIGVWSVFGMLHAAVRPAFGLLGFSVARFGLGLGESGNFPAAIKTVAEWFPKKERALATGIFNAGSNVGAILAPAIIPLIVWSDGTHWQYAFLTTGVFSAIWIVFWLKIYRRPAEQPQLSAGELAYIESDSTAESSTQKIPWRKVLPLRETWAFAAAKLTDAVWWFYLFWGGKFLFDQFGLNIGALALPLITIYVIADGGSVLGGWLSSHWIKQGWSVNRARKITMLICSLCIMPVMFCTQMGTRFNVNDAFLAGVKNTAYAVENVVTVNGQPTRQTVQQHISDDTLKSLNSLSGQSYGSAKEFLQAVYSTVGGAKVTAVLPALQKALGADLTVSDAFLDQAKPLVADEVFLALKGLKGKTYKSAEEFQSALSAAVGKAQTGKFDSALLDGARSDKLYWIAVLLIAFAAAGHQAWSANVFTLVSDVFPKKATASVTGIGGMVGGIAGIVADRSLGKVLTASGPSAYFWAFLVAGSCYLVLLGVVHVLMPKLTPLDDNLRRISPRA